MRFLVTGGAGFIGSNFLHQFVGTRQDAHWLCVDKLTYAGNLQSLDGLIGRSDFEFAEVALEDAQATDACVTEFRPDVIIHFAAETHVDRSIKDPRASFASNATATLNLLESARALWTSPEGKRFHHVSTDEVFGSLEDDGAFSETTAYDPSSPYSATKAASDHLVRAWNRTFGLPVTISNCSNNYGPRQFPEKLIPLMILRCLRKEPLPVYGKGLNVRDWIHVDDHNRAVMSIIEHGRSGETYNIGARNEWRNIDIVHEVTRIVAEETQEDVEALRDLITYVTDRPGHDFRYAINPQKIETELGWQPEHDFSSGLRQTVRWYLENSAWVVNVISGEYRQWIDHNYVQR